MRCGPKRFFDGQFKACVLQGSTRATRRDKSAAPKASESAGDSFNCTGKKLGKYPDDEDCHFYHLCLPPEDFEPSHLSVECPHSTAFDPCKKKCSRKVKLLCGKEEPAINYEQQIRFRETRSCDRYFLYLADQMTEFMCQVGYKFDENLQFCQPERFVSCDCQ